MIPFGLAKVHCLKGVLGTDKTNFDRVISKVRCCDLENFSRTSLSGKRLQRPTLAKAKSGLVPVFLEIKNYNFD